jgi:hypothetical protein
MANPLTGDYEGVVQISLRHLNAVLGHVNHGLATTLRRHDLLTQLSIFDYHIYSLAENRHEPDKYQAVEANQTPKTGLPFTSSSRLKVVGGC